jgi:hypothetical protein
MIPIRASDADQHERRGRKSFFSEIAGSRSKQSDPGGAVWIECQSVGFVEATGFQAGSWPQRIFLANLSFIGIGACKW